MHQDGAQFICNGITLYYFNEYRAELEALPQTNGESINAKQILNTKQIAEDLNAEELQLLNNIKKYISFYKTLKGIDKRASFPVPAFGKIYDAKIILECCEVYNFNFNNLKVVRTENEAHPTQTTNGKITAVLLPMRIRKEEDKNKIEENYKNFIEIIKG